MLVYTWLTEAKVSHDFYIAYAKILMLCLYKGHFMECVWWPMCFGVQIWLWMIACQSTHSNKNGWLKNIKCFWQSKWKSLSSEWYFSNSIWRPSVTHKESVIVSYRIGIAPIPIDPNSSPLHVLETCFIMWALLFSCILIREKQTL